MRSFRNLMTTGRVASTRLIGAVGVASIAALAACEDAGAPTWPTVAPTSPSAAVGVGPSLYCPACSVSDYILAVRPQAQPNPQIIKVKPDGSGLVVLTTGHSPAWSPSKTKIAFVRDVAGSPEIFTMNADGSNVAQITSSPTTKELDPTWSPDGQYIAYASNKNPYGAPFDRLDVWTMKSDGTAPVKLTWASNIDELRPTWSKDFTKIAYMHRMDPEPYQIWVMTLDPATRQPTLASQVTPPQLTADAMNPAFSPDGSQIAFDHKPGGCGISIIDANADGDGASMHAISIGGDFYCTQPTWSPNGAKLAFQVPNLWNGAIVTANANGTGFQQVTSGKYGDYTPTWSR